MKHLTVKENLLTLIGISLLGFTVFMDFTIVSTALPAIQKDVGANIIELQWIMNAFSLLLAVMTAVMGKLSDIIGKKNVLFTGVIVFGITSIFAGLTKSIDILIFLRAIQGFSSAMILPSSFALVASLYRGSGKAMSIFSGITGTGLAAGPFLGGLIVSEVHWGWIFFINIPIIFIGILICYSRLPKEEFSKAESRFDFWGVILLIGSIGCTTFGFIDLVRPDFNNYMLFYFIAALIFLVLFIWQENRITYPMIHLGLFKKSYFLISVILITLCGGVVSVFLFLTPLYLVAVKEVPFFEIGLILSVLTVFEVVATFFTGKVVDKFGAKWPIFYSALFFTIGGLFFMFFDIKTTIFYIIITMALCGLGWGIFNVAPPIAISSIIDRKKVGMAMGSAMTFNSIGSVVILAIATVLFQFFEEAKMKELLAKNNEVLSASDVQLVKEMLRDPDHAKDIASKFGYHAHEIYPLFKQAFIGGLEGAVMFLSILCFISLGAIFFIITKMKKSTS